MENKNTKQLRGQIKSIELCGTASNSDRFVTVNCPHLLKNEDIRFSLPHKDLRNTTFLVGATVKIDITVV